MSEQSTALARRDYNTELTQAGYMAGLMPENYVIRPKMLELVQPIVAGEGVIAGRFRDKKSNFQFEKMQIVPLEFRPGRVYFPPDESTSSEPICRSNDGKLPVIGFDNLVPQADSCKTCQWSQWKKIKGQGGKTVSVKPPCAETMLFTFIDSETNFIYRLNGKGMNLTPLKDFRQTLFEMVMMARAKGKTLPHFGLTSLMSSTKVQGKKGTYFVLTFSPPEPINDPAEFGPIYERVVLRNDVADDDAEPATVEYAVGAAVEGEYVDA
jgi:hypothetical protein